MNESYKELLVKKDRGTKEVLIRVACVIPTILAGLLMLATVNIIFFIAVIALGVFDYFINL